jgi:hypothetical protein
MTSTTKKILYSLLSACAVAIAGLLLSSGVPMTGKATYVSDGVAVQVLDFNNNELTDPDNRPTISGGRAFIELPFRSSYRIKLINPTASCGVTTRFNGYLRQVTGEATAANFNAPFDGNASALLGWVATTNLANDDTHFLTIEGVFFRTQ